MKKALEDSMSPPERILSKAMVILAAAEFTGAT
jgi:hypothetical protein